MDLDPQDRDMMVRTIIGEAGDQPDDGQLAVGGVILNRLNSGRYGDSPTKVVLASGQFEPWQTRARELLNIDPNSPQYQKIGGMVDALASGQAKDPTGGATYFLQPDVVRARRGGALPDWASGRSIKIGGHVFYYDKGNQVASSSAWPSVTPDDMDETARALGLSGTPVSSPQGTAISAPGASVTPADIAATTKELGIDTAMPPDRPATATSPRRITIPKYHQPPMPISEGMPLVGPALNMGTAASFATLDPVMNALRSMLGKQPDPAIPAAWGERYAQHYKDITDANQNYAEQHPAANAVQGLAGGGMLLGPLARAPLVGRMLGTTGESLPIKQITGAVGGGLIGGTDAYMRGENPVTGAEIGAGAGVVGPLIGAGASGGARAVVNATLPRTGPLAQYMPATISRLIQAVEGETPKLMSQNVDRMGPHGFIGDLNTGLTDLAGGAADIPGPQKQVVRQAYQQRAAGQRQRIDKALTDAYGTPAVDVNAFTKWLTETRAAAADPLYQQWRSMEVHPTQKLKDMIPRLEAAGAFNKAEELSGISGKPINKTFFTAGNQKEYPTTEAWDYVKRGLDSRIDNAYSAGDKTLGRELVKLKKELIAEIGKTPAGKVWAEGRAGFAERSSIIDQIAAGRDDLIGARSGITADELKEELSTLNGPELMARLTGQRKAIAEDMGRTLNGDGAVRAKLLAPNNQEKLELSLGKDRAGKLIKALEQEQYLMGQDSNVRGNIQTGASGSMRGARRDALLPNPMQPWDFDFTKPGSWLPPHLREAYTPHGMVNARRSDKALRQLNELAPLLTMPQQAPQFSDVLRAIQAEQTRRATSPFANLGAGVNNSLSGLIAAPQIQRQVGAGNR